MSRLADGAIKGFLYQFHKTALVILEAGGEDVITVEGVVEDIDVDNDDGSKTAIQCKYHEGSSAYTPSLIYKPVLLMAEHCSKNPPGGCTYHIFIHVPSQATSRRHLLDSELDAALLSQDQSLLKIISRIDPALDRLEFLGRTHLEFGASLTELESSVKEALAKAEVSGADVASVLYPNAIQHVARISTAANEADRKLTRASFLQFLKRANQTAITHWTLSLREKDQFLRVKRDQLKQGLQQNSRDRRFYFEEGLIDNFSDEIVNFISNYVSKYHHKKAHNKTPMFAISASREAIAAIAHRLFKKGMKAATGRIGEVFDVAHFYREPMVSTPLLGEFKREFDIRLVPSADELSALSHKKGDELFVVANDMPVGLDLSDMNVSLVGVGNFKELEFVLSMRASYE